MLRTFRSLLNVLLGLVLLRVWHLFVLRLDLDRPWAIAGWLVAVFVLVVLARGLARSTRAASRGWSARWWSSVHTEEVILFAFFLCLLFVFHWAYERAASDGRDYFVQVHSLVMDHDFDFRNDTAAFGASGSAARYPIGGPVLWVPFFVLCHLWLTLLNRFGGAFTLDGYGIPYQMAIGLGSLVYGCVALVLVYRLLTDYFSRRLALATTLVVCCGFFLVWYLVVENSMVHAVSMFATTLFLFTWQRGRGGRTATQWACLGAAAGLMAMVRWQDILFLAVPGLDALAASWRSGGARKVAASAAIFGVCATVACAPQLLFWKIARGAFINPPAAEHGVDLASSLHVADTLFSPNHGLVSWTPLVYVAILGLLPFFRRDRTLLAALVVGLLAQIYVAGTIDVGWGGSGYGARRFADCALVFAVGLASAFDWSKRHPTLAPGLIVSAFVLVNATFMLDVESGRLPSGEGIVIESMLDSLFRRVGNPFSFPESALVAWRYHVGWSFYDRMKGRTYNGLTIDMGRPDDDLFLGPGWSAPETSERSSMRWAVGLESTVLVSLKREADYALDLRCQPFTYAGAPAPQAAKVLVNGVLAGRVLLENGMSHYQLQIPARVIRPGINELRFRYRYATSPSSLGQSSDTRPLAMACETIQLSRLPGVD